ncbi:polyprenyl glycosylphosphotransferase [Knoellia sinensis KCTC 19936]|uniref:Polyprenyl glycosylphosphotransferase n=1 Tax=Knoellia sinensis KCTC 19936 TaxID=1385520 RepID=A0A0A0JC93_9MICO|nr:polyprenyl glycosylphosphotransferase [Knoellia sinensis KCTC 19936]
MVGLPIIALWIVSLLASGAYERHIFGAGSAEYGNVLRASTYAAGLVGIACFLGRYELSRGFFFFLFLIGIPLLLLGRFAGRKLLQRLHRSGRLQHTVLIVGGPRQVDEITGVLHREKWLGMRVIGALLPGPNLPEQTPRGLEVLGSSARTVDLVQEHEVDIVLFAGGAVGSARELRRAAWDLEETDVQMLIAPNLTDVAWDRIRPRPAAGLPLLEFEGPRSHDVAHGFKRLFDFVFGALLVVLLSPVMFAIAIAITASDGGPALFRQRRVGRYGEHFDLLKFRSMVVGADELIDDVREHSKHDEDHILFKSESDPRVTSVGRFLRRFSLDELPQLFNVVMGDMSLVGPRPPLQSEVDQYHPDVHRRLKVRPGMTGLWQVSGRADLSWEDSVRLDLYYVDNWSITQDIVILARTVTAVVTSRGAY